MSSRKRRDEFGVSHRDEAAHRGLLGKMEERALSDPVETPEDMRKRKATEFRELISSFRLAIGGTKGPGKYVMTRDFEGDDPFDPRAMMAAEATSGQLESLGVRTSWYETSVSVSLPDFAAACQRHSVNPKEIIPDNQYIVYEQELARQQAQQSKGSKRKASSLDLTSALQPKDHPRVADSKTNDDNPEKGRS